MTASDRTLRNVSGGFRSLCLVHDTNIDTDPGEIFTVTMSQAEYDDALATGWFADAESALVEGDGGDGANDLAEAIRTVLAGLDPDDDSHWTLTGLPAMAPIEAVLGKDVSRADVTAALPGFKRPG